jgi:putative oxidoreductase
MTSQASSDRLPGRQSLRARIVATSSGTGVAMLRVTLAAVMFPHGAQKLLGWFGGHGPAGTLQFLTSVIGLPAPLAGLVIAIEFFAPLLLLVGFFARPAALAIGAVMAGAIATVHAHVGFFMDWGGSIAGEGFEYHLLVLGMVAAIAVEGAGRFSLDRTWTRRAESDPERNA